MRSFAMGLKRAGWRRGFAGIVGAGACGLAGAQTVATGDARTVTEPVIPASCTVLQAQQAISNGEPTSETTFDTTTIQSALTNCGSGKAVELTASGGNNAFLIGPITIPAGVTLLVDGGVTVFGSRNPADYQVGTAGSGGIEACGTVGTAGNGCKALITASSANAGIMGYGIIDGRGQDKLLVNGAAATYSWWDQAGTAQNTSGGAQNNPILLSANAANLILYKITFRNSPMFHVKWSGNSSNKTGFTAWGVKVITPFSARNTDGIDPSGENISILNSSISDGDDMIAVSASSAASNITIANDNTYSGHGISVGSYTQGGLTNMLVQNIMEMGTATDRNGGGLRIKTAQDRGGVVQNVTYQNICMANEVSTIYLSPYYNSNSGTDYPTFSNILYRNIHVATEGSVTLQGYANTGATVIHPATIFFDNLIFDTLVQNDLSPTPAYLTIALGPGPVTSLLQSLTGTGVTYTSSTISNTYVTPYACNTDNFQYLVGELYGTTGTATNLHTAYLSAPATITLNAMLQPAMSQVSYTSNSSGGTYTGKPAPTAQVKFYDGQNQVGTGTLGGNGTIASLTLTGLALGPHTFTAVYPGDSTYAVPLTMGTVTVEVDQQTTTTTETVGPATSTYGASTMLSATVTSATSGTPTGSVNFMDDYTGLTYPATLIGGSASTSVQLAAGMHKFLAFYPGDSNYASSLSNSPKAVIVSPAVLTVTPSNASRTFAAVNPTLSYSITGFVNGDSASVVSGAPTLTTAATRISPVGTYQIVAGPGSLAAANYSFTFAPGTLMVTGGATQAIVFPPLYNFSHGTSVYLLATASSGQNIAYSVIGPATVSASTLTITGTGTVTVTASQAGNANYAAATPVTQSFTAQ
jgi:polygalacturonase